MDRKNILLRRVRDVQQYLAIGAEILMLIAFFVSGVDASVGGAMADNFWIKLGWAIVFGLSIDTLFVLSWVRVRQIGLHLHLLWAIPLALGLSFIVFQPVAIQLLQQSLSINFNQALSYLGINIVILVYARSLVAVCLGAILALTNVESEQVQAIVRPKRTLLVWQNFLDKYAPIEQESKRIANLPSEPLSEPRANTEPLPEETIEPEQETNVIAFTGKQTSKRSTSTKYEQVRKVLAKNPDASLPEIMKKTGVSKGYASQVKNELRSKHLLATGGN